MFWSVVLSVCLALAIPVETKNVGDNISEQATLSTFLAMAYFLMTTIYIAAVSSNSSSSSEEDADSREEVIPDQSGDEIQNYNLWNIILISFTEHTSEEIM